MNTRQDMRSVGFASLALVLLTACGSGSSSGSGSEPSTFRDCEGCPTLVVIPPLDEKTWGNHIRYPKAPATRRTEKIERYSITETPITFEQWEWYRCSAFGACRYRPEDFGWGRGERPIIYKTWNDIAKFISWLNEHTGQTYRLPSEEEWEFAARAGVHTEFSTGDCISTDYANFAGTIPFNNCETGVWRQQTTPVKSFSPNEWGIYGVHGNVWELVDECWSDRTVSLSSEINGNSGSGCEFGTGRGGAWTSDQSSVGFSARTMINLHSPSDTVGFRLVRTLNAGDLDN